MDSISLSSAEARIIPMHVSKAGKGRQFKFQQRKERKRNHTKHYKNIFNAAFDDMDILRTYIWFVLHSKVLFLENVALKKLIPASSNLKASGAFCTKIHDLQNKLLPGIFEGQPWVEVCKTIHNSLMTTYSHILNALMWCS